jgi:hypothetical protein
MDEVKVAAEPDFEIIRTQLLDKSAASSQLLSDRRLAGAAPSILVLPAHLAAHLARFLEPEEVCAVLRGCSVLWSSFDQQSTWAYLYQRDVVHTGGQHADRDFKPLYVREYLQPRAPLMRLIALTKSLRSVVPSQLAASAAPAPQQSKSSSSSPLSSSESDTNKRNNLRDVLAPSADVQRLREQYPRLWSRFERGVPGVVRALSPCCFVADSTFSRCSWLAWKWP